MRNAFAALAATCVLAFGGCGEDDTGGAPEVQGLSLPSAEQKLKAAGFNADVSSDALFGVVIKENYIVCDQSEPAGKLVPLEVSKDC